MTPAGGWCQTRASPSRKTSSRWRRSGWSRMRPRPSSAATSRIRSWATPSAASSGGGGSIATIGAARPAGQAALGEGLAELVALGLGADDLDEQAAGLGQEVTGGARAPQVAGVEHDHVVADLLELAEQVGGDEDGDAELAADALHQPEHVVARRRVEAVGRLVEEDQLRVVGERLGELGALLHAGGVAAHRPVALLVEPHVPQHVGRPLASGGGAEAGHPGHVDGEVAGADVGRQAVVLGHVADESPDLLPAVLDVVPQDAGVPAGRLEQAQQDLDQRRLAGAVGADEAGHAGSDLDRQVGQRVDRAVVLGEARGRDDLRWTVLFPRHARHASGTDDPAGIRDRPDRAWRSCGGRPLPKRPSALHATHATVPSRSVRGAAGRSVRPRGRAASPTPASGGSVATYSAKSSAHSLARLRAPSCRGSWEPYVVKCSTDDSESCGSSQSTTVPPARVERRARRRSSRRGRRTGTAVPGPYVVGSSPVTIVLTMSGRTRRGDAPTASGPASTSFGSATEVPDELQTMHASPALLCAPVAANASRRGAAGLDIPRLVCRQGPPDFESGLATMVRLHPGEPLVLGIATRCTSTMAP